MRSPSSGCAKGISGWTHSSPWSSSGSVRKNGDPMANGWTLAQTSCTHPASVSSSLRSPPPGVSAPSSTSTDRPASATVIAAARPFGPEPITTASYRTPGGAAAGRCRCRDGRPWGVAGPAPASPPASVAGEPAVEGAHRQAVGQRDGRGDDRHPPRPVLRRPLDAEAHGGAPSGGGDGVDEQAEPSAGEQRVQSQAPLDHAVERAPRPAV